MTESTSLITDKIIKPKSVSEAKRIHDSFRRNIYFLRTKTIEYKWFKASIKWNIEKYVEY